MSENTKIFEIKINGVKESVTNLESLEDVLQKMEKQVENINKNGGFSVVSKEANKNAKESIDLAKAEQIAQGEVISSYKEKQKALSTLGKEIKTMTAADAESTKRQQELIENYNELNGELKRFDASMGNHQRNVGDYRGALRETTQEIKALEGEMAAMLANGVSQTDKAFTDLAQKAGAMQDAVNDAKDAVKRFASDTKVLDDVVNVAQSATAAFELYKGAMSAFGVETENAEKAMQQLVGAMSVIQSLQTLQNTLQGSTATAKLFSLAMKASGAELVVNQVNAIKAAAAQKGLSTAQKAGAVASKTLSLALKAIPLMLVIGLITELVLHWEDLVGWFDKTFPALKKMGGLMNVLKGTVAGLGKAIVHWLTNPIKTLAEVVKKVLQGDFAGAAKAAVDGIKNQFTGFGEAFQEGFTNQVNKGLEDVTRKQAAELDKQLTHQRNMITKQKNEDGTYRKEYIEANKKMFDNRKKMYKKDSDEYRKVLEEEAQFNQQIEDAKTAATKKGAADRTKANKEAAKQAAKDAADAAKLEGESLKKFNEALKKLDDAFYKAFQAETKEDLRKLENELEKFNEGPIEKLVDTLNKIEDLKGEILDGEQTKAFNDLWNGLDENLKKVFGSVENLREHNGYLSMEQVEAQENVEKSFSGTTKAIENQVNAFRASIEEVQTSIKVIVKNTKNSLDELDRQSERKLADAYQRVANAQIKNAENLYKNFVNSLKNVDVTPVRNRITGLIDEKATLKKFEEVRNGWIKLQKDIKKEITNTEANWDQTIARLKNLYTEYSQIYKDAVQAKIDALERLKKVQEEVGKRASTPLSLNNDYNADGTSDTPKYKKLWYGKGEKDRSGKEYSLIDNLANLATELDEMVLGPAMDTFNMFMDFAIEETQAKLEEVQDMHDDALDKVEESTNKIKELNDSLKDSSNTNIEVTKQQLADEQILYAQRLAEEQKLAQEEKNLQNKANEQQYQARKMELGYQLVLSIANTAQGASKALADWGWPLGAIFAGLTAALGAVQTALIAKQLSSLPKPKKLADGGLLSGPSHAQGGIRLGNVEVEGGEAVINKRSTEKYRGLLDAINAAGNGGKHTLADKKIRKFADGGTLNFERADDNLRKNADTNRLLSAIDNIDFQPVVSVVDFEKVQSRLVKVRSLAGR